jgi:2-polyprenyl-3-methyl-5-hydroxy-6-metoxy-1,4-benzoquinol methylase
MKTFAIGCMQTKEQNKIPSLDIACNVCGKRDKKVYWDCEDFSFAKCRHCGLVYQYPQPAFEELKARYRQAYFQYELENDQNFFELMVLGLKDIGFDKLPDSYFPSRRFLDIGCATGLLVRHMRDSGWEAQGVELCEESASYGIQTRGVPIFIGTLEAAAFPENYFSVIHFSHLIEHVPDPSLFLTEVRRILAPGGMAIITTPNRQGLQARLLGRNWRSAIADHLTLFSKKTFAQLLKKAGFASEKVVTWGGLAKGLAPPWLKRPIDQLAKKWGFGDVMLFQVKKLTDLGT